MHCEDHVHVYFPYIASMLHPQCHLLCMNSKVIVHAYTVLMLILMSLLYLAIAIQEYK